MTEQILPPEQRQLLQSGVPLTKRERRRLKREQRRSGGSVTSGQGGRSGKSAGRWGWWLLVLVILAAAVYGLYRVATKPRVNGGNGVTLNAPVTAEDWRRGSANAPAVLVEYSDFQCPACGFYEPWVQQLVKDFPTELAVIYRHFPLQQHLNALWAARAAEAAGLQGKFWEMHDLLFARQDDWAERLDAKAVFATYAGELKLNVNKFKTDFNSAATKDAAEADQASGTASGVTGTPTFYLNNQQIDNPKTYDDFANLIRAAAAAATSTDASQ